MSDFHQVGDPPYDRGPILGVPKDDLDAMRARVEALEAENKRLREALTFYADLPAEWTIDPKGRSDDMRYGNLHLLGESARAALKE